MLPTSKAHLWDAHQACLAALSFVEGIDVHEFQVNLLVQSAVERQLEILAHEYGTVDHEIVWAVVDARLSPLAARLAALLED